MGSFQEKLPTFPKKHRQLFSKTWEIRKAVKLHKLPVHIEWAQKESHTISEIETKKYNRKQFSIYIEVVQYIYRSSSAYI